MSDATAIDQPLRILIVDDHDVVHWGFRLMLSDLPDLPLRLPPQLSGIAG